MRHWLFSTLSNRLRRSPRSPLPTRPTLESLEDRCVPTANFLPFLGMHGTFMHPVNVNTAVVNTPATNTTVLNTLHNTPNPSTLAALNQLFTDFNRTMQQVMSSQTLQQFVANETNMLRIIGVDLTHLRTVESPAIFMRG
jgi:hypothetical protein